MTKKELQEQFATLVGQYEVADSAGRKAGIARKINDLQVDMYDQGVDFTPWEAPRSYSTSYTETEEQVLEAIEVSRRVLADANAPDVVKHGADTRLKSYLKKAANRSIDVPAAS